MTRAALRLIRAETTKRAQPAVTVANARTSKKREEGIGPQSSPDRHLAPVLASKEIAETHPHGHWPLLTLRSHSQCHYPMGRDAKGRHRFCGDPSPIGPGNPHGVWCEAHRAVVFGDGTVSEREADRMGKEVRS